MTELRFRAVRQIGQPISENQMLAMLDAADHGGAKEKRLLIAAMRKTDWSPYRKFRLRLAALFERIYRTHHD